MFQKKLLKLPQNLQFLLLSTKKSSQAKNISMIVYWAIEHYQNNLRKIRRCHQERDKPESLAVSGTMNAPDPRLS